MKKILTIVPALLITASAFAVEGAGLFVEPMITYEQGEGEIDYPSPIKDSDTDVKGFGAGARLGFHVLDTVFIGADGRYSKPTFKESGFHMNTDAEAWNWGPTAGVQLPTAVSLRVWGTYIVDGALNPEKDKGIDPNFTEGSGYRLGAGIKLWMVSLNVEWQKMEFDRTKAKTSLANFDSKKIDVNNDSWIFSVSFPLGL